MTTIYERGRQPNILLIDDNLGDARLIQVAFKKTRVPPRVTVAQTAEQGMDLLRGNNQAAGERPDIIFLDLNLPAMHGLTFLEIVKNDPELTSIPLLVISSTSAKKDISDCYLRHANGFVTKPSSLDGYRELAESISAHWFNFLRMPTNDPRISILPQ